MAKIITLIMLLFSLNSFALTAKEAHAISEKNHINRIKQDYKECKKRLESNIKSSILNGFYYTTVHSCNAESFNSLKEEYGKFGYKIQILFNDYSSMYLLIEW